MKKPKVEKLEILLARETGFTRRECRETLDGLVRVLKREQRAHVIGLGHFFKKIHKARDLRTLIGSKKMPEREVLKFKASVQYTELGQNEQKIGQAGSEWVDVLDDL